MSARVRVGLIVGVAAVAAAGVAVGATLLQSGGGDSGNALVTTPQAGVPPLVLDLGVRDDPEAVALRRASALYAKRRRAAAGRIFARYDSLPARIGAAFAAWPDGSLARVAGLARTHPLSSLARLHLGFALFWEGHRREAVAAWRAAERVEPDSPSALTAEDLLHPNSPRGRPNFVPSFAPPASLQKLSPAGQLAALARRARFGGAREKLLYGVALQRLGRPISAERAYAAAATRAPRDAEAQVAAAVGRFEKDHPERAFSRLGPLARRFPHAPTVRFHLGLLLLWIGQVDQAKRELRLARSEGPATPLGREANRFLKRLGGIRTR